MYFEHQDTLLNSNPPDQIIGQKSGVDSDLLVKLNFSEDTSYAQSLVALAIGDCATSSRRVDVWRSQATNICAHTTRSVCPPPISALSHVFCVLLETKEASRIIRHFSFHNKTKSMPAHGPFPCRQTFHFFFASKLAHLTALTFTCGG